MIIKLIVLKINVVYKIYHKICSTQVLNALQKTNLGLVARLTFKRIPRLF